MTRALHRPIIRFAAILSTVGGFCGVMASMLAFGVAGVPGRFSSAWQLGFTLYLSVLAIVQASAILVGTKQGEAATHAKLDGLIAAIDKADNRLIGLEKRMVVEEEE